MSEIPAQEPSPLTLVSLFSGAGGLDVGLENAGFTTLVASDIEHWAVETLRGNQLVSSLDAAGVNRWLQQVATQRCYQRRGTVDFQGLQRRLLSYRPQERYLAHAQIIQGDIRTSLSTIIAATGKMRGQVDLVAGGPPCQPFSRAGKRETVEADEGRLFLQFAKAVHAMRPRWFLFENVKGLLVSRTQVLELRCRICCTETVASLADRDAYAAGTAPSLRCPACQSGEVSSYLVNERGGSLEMILREFASLGYACNWRVLNAADFGAPQVRERLVIVGSRDNEAFAWPEPTHAKAESAAGQLALFDGPRRTRPWRTTRESLWPLGHPKYGPLPASAVLWVKNVVRPHDEPVTWSLDRPAPTVGAHQAAKLALAPNGVPEEQLARQQWHTLGRRQGDTPPVCVEHEYLCDEELLRLQTFPPGWYLHGTRMQRAFQIGNAVPPVLGAALGKALAAACGVALESVA